MTSSIIQAITEFIPVSSSAHLFFLKQELSRFDYALLHLATSFVVLFFERKIILDLLLFKKKILSLNLIFITTITAMSLFFLKEYLMIFKTLEIVIVLLILFSFILNFIFKKKSSLKINLNLFNIYFVVFVSLAQIIGSFSGVSRLGMTCASLYLYGFNRSMAYTYAMILSIPLGIASFGYSFLIDQLIFEKEYLIVTLILSFFSYPVLKKIFIDYGFKPFFYYRILLAFALVVYFFSV